MKKPKPEEIKFRCSELSLLVVQPRTKKAREAGELSQTTITHLVEKIGEVKYGIREHVSTKEMEKGNYAEADAVTLVSEKPGKLYLKNKQLYHNDYIRGIPDIVADEAVIDTKCPYRWVNWATAGMTANYEWQLRGYMMLTGKRIGVLAYCLVDLPEHLLYDELRRQSYYRAVLEGSRDIKTCFEDT